MNGICNINTMLIYGIVVGCLFILVAMVMNIVNGVKNKDFKRVWLDGNGICGLVLYGFVLFIVAYYFIKGKMLVSVNAIVGIVCTLLILILFNDKLTQIVTKKKEEIKIPMVGLCMAIYLLADMTSGAGNLAISVLGNIIVLVLEGLIVGIQILRLEYYELFSRFYEGNGTEYVSIKTQTNLLKKEK